MKKATNKTTKKVTIDDLAAMVANGFDSVHKEIGEFKNDVDKRFNKVEKDIAEVKENLNTTRMDVLGIGDRFISKLRPRRESGDSEFSQHLVRFSLLEQKVKAKK